MVINRKLINKFMHACRKIKLFKYMSIEEVLITIARSRFLGLWYFSQSLALANSSSFFERSLRLMFIALSSATSSPPPSMLLCFWGYLHKGKRKLFLLLKARNWTIFPKNMCNLIGEKLEKVTESGKNASPVVYTWDSLHTPPCKMANFTSSN